MRAEYADSSTDPKDIPGGKARAPTLPETAGDAGILPAATRALGRAAMSFHPASLPASCRKSYRLELTSTFFFAIAIACVEGSIVAVFAKNAFAGVVDGARLYIAIALVGSAGEIANILSFFWSQAQQGRAKVPFINALQVCTLLLIAVLALTPRTEVGLWMLALVVLLARVFWSGIVTIRPTIWRANYPREIRASIVGRLSAVQVLTVACVGMLLGRALDANPESFRVAIPVGAGLGFIAFLALRGLRVRRHGAMLREERTQAQSMPKPQSVLKPWQGPIVVARVLSKDRDFARFMLWMFLLGFGNLMIVPVLVISLSEQFKLGYLSGILITSSIPALVTFVAIPLWARFLNRAHVVRFRAIHSWTFVLATLVLLMGIALNQVWLLYAGAALLGVGFGGGALAWNIGHVDFAPPAQTSQYMATHVTLNGIRGLLAPFTAVAIYTAWKPVSIGSNADGTPAPLGPKAALVVLAVATVISIVGAIGFGTLYRSMGAKARGVKRK